VHRKYHHNNLTFNMLYAYTENFILPLSHDEVVHLKGSLLGKMPGDTWQRAANLRLLFAYQYTMVGKKLLFMSGEFGQWNEWNSDYSIDWHLAAQPPHSGIQLLVKDLGGSTWPMTPSGLGLRAARIPLDRLQRQPAVGPLLRAPRSVGTRGLCVQLHPGAQAPLPHRRAARRPLLRGAQHRRRGLRRQQRRHGGDIWAQPIAWHGFDHSLSLTLRRSERCCSNLLDTGLSGEGEARRGEEEQQAAAQRQPQPDRPAVVVPSDRSTSGSSR